MYLSQPLLYVLSDSECVCVCISYMKKREREKESEKDGAFVANIYYICKCNIPS